MGGQDEDWFFLTTVAIEFRGASAIIAALEGLDAASTSDDQKVLDYCLKSFPYRLFDLTSYICLVGLIVGIGSLSDRGELLGAQILGKSLTSMLK